MCDLAQQANAGGYIAKMRKVIFYLDCNGRQGAQASYRFFFGNASRHSAGTHLSAITQKSRHGGTPV
jgi:hypothetical protein